MKQFIIPILALSMVACGKSEGEKTTDTTNETKATASDFLLDSDNKKISYALGLDQVQFLETRGVLPYIDPEAFQQGMQDALDGAPQIKIEEGIELLKQKQMGPFIKNKEMGENFLIENAKRPEVITLNSGLQYEVLKKGNGPIPTINDQFEAHYVGTTIDGEEFDSSYKSGQPLKYPVNQMIPGWVEALQLMPVGSKWKLYVPWNLAYGERGTPNGGPIEPYETLIFEMELLSIPK